MQAHISPHIALQESQTRSPHLSSGQCVTFIPCSLRQDTHDPSDFLEEQQLQEGLFEITLGSNGALLRDAPAAPKKKKQPQAYLEQDRAQLLEFLKKERENSRNRNPILPAKLWIHRRPLPVGTTTFIDGQKKLKALLEGLRKDGAIKLQKIGERSGDGDVSKWVVELLDK